MDYKLSQKFGIPVLITTMQPTHRSVRKAVSLIVSLLLIFALSPFCSCCAATISDTFTYDANGNMISGSGFIFVYNDANQLVNVINESDSSIVAEYFYDANGQRVKKIEGGVTTYYIGDYVETRVDGSTVDNTSYYFANNERVARKDPDGAIYYYHGDHLGSTSVVTDSTGAQSEKVSYYPYGSMKERVGEGSTYLYTDQEFDDESGLYYYGARYYDPELTRFIQPDTVTQDVYNPQNLNRYSYVLNNPLKYTDPSGQVVIMGLLVLAVAYGIWYEWDYCSKNPIDPSDPGDLGNIWIEGGKGIVVGSAHYITGKLAHMAGGGDIVGGSAGALGARVTENVLAEEENKLEGATEAIVGGAVAGKLSHSSKIYSPLQYELSEAGRAASVEAGKAAAIEFGVLKITEAVTHEIEESVFSEQHDYEYDYFNPEYPYGYGADPSSYTRMDWSYYYPYQPYKEDGIR